jgi:hypothetical protein
MAYRVHRPEIRADKEQDKLEQFLTIQGSSCKSIILKKTNRGF